MIPASPYRPYLSSCRATSHSPTISLGEAAGSAGGSGRDVGAVCETSMDELLQLRDHELRRIFEEEVVGVGELERLMSRKGALKTL
jgi:hypothetical protein